MIKKKVIFIADDDPDDRELFADAVAEINNQITCVTASNGQDALKLLQKKEQALPDFIFLDLNMPRISGKQCLTELKKIERLQTVPVIIYTTAKIDDDMKEMKELGASYFLIKPNKFDELVNAISIIINGKTMKGPKSSIGILSVL
jgi:DNA-binding response OmpR family regulator